MGDGEITGLPEGCISDILSLTSPSDCCRSAAVSHTFRSIADSGAVWDRFLPSDLSDLLSRAVGAVDFASKKELYFRLCDGILIDGSRMMFSLERLDGFRCYTLSARELNIVWGDDPRYWTWGPHQDSRFPEVAKLSSVCWLEIRGKLDCGNLSQRTYYTANLIFKLARGSYNLTNQISLVTIGGFASQSKVCLQPNDGDDDEEEEEEDTMEEEEEAGVVGSHVAEEEMEEEEEEPDNEDDTMEEEEEEEEIRAVRRAPEVGTVPRRRHDGWMEMELGQFFNFDGDDGEVEMSLMGKEGFAWKRGLVVEGIEVRPL